MIANLRERPLSADTIAAYGKDVFVDGEPVNQVWYVDTDLGIVKSYDVCGDGKAHTVNDPIWLDLPNRANVEVLGDYGLLSRTILGRTVRLEATGKELPLEMVEYIAEQGCAGGAPGGSQRSRIDRRNLA